MQTLQVLKGARALITSPGHWTVDTRDNRHGGHCALGALSVAMGMSAWTAEDHCPEAVVVLAEATPAGKAPVEAFNGYLSQVYIAAAIVAGYNNSHSHAEVLAWFDRAIANLEGPKALPKSLTDLLVEVKQEEIVA
jgi:hypothetical protein